MIQRLLAIISLTVAMIWSITAVAQNVGLVDMRKVFQALPQIKKINASLERQFLSRREKVIRLGKSLQDNVNKLQRNESVMSKKEIVSLRDTIQKQRNQLQEDQRQFQQALFTAQNKAMVGFMTRITGVVENIAKKENLDLILLKDTVLYTKDGKDITSDVVSALK
ncbi:OmpH family outer membrane protein [Coxiella endosymbiont of Amblyomma nuttalli]|uniref:OmpH family outer membrane protein n=1 Tax=Coxiella endosymbiont of Amblyomma nuttalli TaxID=2749996 RepID=UPI001BABF86B|nr:OmpH family outer membrane protein [Coxiella endosymbiont of Amblyomma nuttalli]QTS83710.1 Chaperone protein Skp precursor [Coxiella endosymbiont of Amblyomma nuttalli]